eukprot:CAMPEP_0119137070 /NCGR_PEP_ID=MMETSP1310-20130426/22807_1 /TAXON_ID=464262 /ORGANISM="Genus nov. species nov., Strain RCC2339" /LENGTH=187 /DNA_ID=CAMNT_0007128123 /DNA_START=154 /DNA_END=714 /DNA_ORIENTATION=+
MDRQREGGGASSRSPWYHRAGHSLNYVAVPREEDGAIHPYLITFGGTGVPIEAQLGVFDVLAGRWLALDLTNPVATRPKESRPSPRAFHSASLLMRRYLVVFGGAWEDSFRKDTLWVLDTYTADWSWDFKRVEGPEPSPRFGHSACVINESQVVIFGGILADDTYSNELWSLREVGGKLVWESYKCE